MTEILQGKVKTVYDVESEPEKVMIVFHDKVTAGNGKLVEYPKDKGATCCLTVSYTHLTLPTTPYV